MEYKLFYIIGSLLLFLIIVLAINAFDILNIVTRENYQGFSRSQVASMIPCTAGLSSNCTYINYYDYSGNIRSGNFSNLPNNFYLDASNILQPVPYGNKVNPDRKGYSLDSKYSTGVYSAIAQSSDNAIANPVTCDPTQASLYYPNTGIVCGNNIKYIMTNDNKIVSQTGNIIIPDGYYISAGVLTRVPYGYREKADKTGIEIKNDYQAQLSSTTYDTNNYSMTYHTDASNGSRDSSQSAGNGKMWVLDNCGNLISVPYSDVSGTTLYNEPGSFRFGSSNYVPNYEESVYLSKLTNISTVAPVVNSTENSAGFCSALYPDKDALEQKCNALDTNACASTSCCVLLGGEKCVYGSEAGPYFKSNYSNFMIKNPEFYYYQGKCYGNCPS